MLHFQEGELEVLPASEDKLYCVECGHRLANWRAKQVGGAELVPYCGWCLMYGQSQWGRDNADEILYVGEFVRNTALANWTKRTHVPELDARHRLNWRDSERYVMGIVFTSRTLKVSFARVAHIQARLEEFYGSGDQETGGGSSGDVPEAEGRPESEAPEREGPGDHHGAQGA